MNLKDIIKSRYSVRSFTKKNVDIEIIKEILQISKCAPSGGNIQPWKVYVVTGNAKEKLIERALSNYDNGVQEKIEYEIYPNPLDESIKKEDQNVLKTCMRHCPLSKMILNQGLHKLEKILNFLVHQWA